MRNSQEKNDHVCSGNVIWDRAKRSQQLFQYLYTFIRVIWRLLWIWRCFLCMAHDEQNEVNTGFASPVAIASACSDHTSGLKLSRKIPPKLWASSHVPRTDLLSCGRVWIHASFPFPWGTFRPSATLWGCFCDWARWMWKSSWNSGLFVPVQFMASKMVLCFYF